MDEIQDLLDMMDDGNYDNTLMETIDMFIVDKYIEENREAMRDLFGGSRAFDEALDQLIDI